jgi:hypothetical protein
MPLIQVDLHRELEPLYWLVRNLFLMGYINLIASLPGHGKTAILTGLAWQASRPQGGEFLGERVDPGVTIFLDYDAPGDGRSIRYWLEQHRVAFPDGDISKIIVLEPDPNTHTLSDAEFNELAALIKEKGASLVIIDSFMAAFPHVDPIKLTAVQGPLLSLRRLAADTGAAVLLVDHLPKPMKNEKIGARGPMGSIAKTAQCRTVHILNRLPENEVQGLNVLSWTVTKSSFAAVPEPFGVELRFENGGVTLSEADLPNAYSETKAELAQRVMQNHLLALQGASVDQRDLLEVAMKECRIGRSTAKTALKQLLLLLGDRVETVHLPVRGQPVAYRLKGTERRSGPYTKN